MRRSLIIRMRVDDLTGIAKRFVSIHEGGQQMGNWFENMEPMDIQAERRATKEAREELAQVKTELSDTETKLSKIKDENSGLKDENNGLKDEIDDLVQSMIQMVKQFKDDKDFAVQKLVSGCGKSREEAEKLVDRYWL